MKNIDKIIEFLKIHYSNNDGSGETGKYIPILDRHITDVRMAGDIVNEYPYTILTRNPHTCQTSIINCRDIKTAKSGCIKYLNEKDGFISHVFNNGDEIFTHIEIKFSDE